MAKIKFYYNTKTCKYERVVTSWRDVWFNLLGFLVLSTIVSGCIVVGYFSFFDSPKEKILKEENDKMKSNFLILNTKISQIQKDLKILKDKDNSIYRIIFENKQNELYGELENSENINYQKSLLSMTAIELHDFTLNKINHTKVFLSKEIDSYNELLVLANKKQEMLASIPAILPVSSKHLRSLASGYGMRMHPIYKVLKFHAGCDFSAVRGTPIYATGNGVVSISLNFEGYGNCIEIDHGFGYMTRYGHCSKIKAKNGSKVKRGEIIGFVGSSGTATSPHLHYEVHKNGSTVDPVHYFFNNLNPAEYQELIKIAAEENQSLG